VHRNQIARWKVQLQKAPQGTPMDGDAALREEVARLRRENAELAEENALLRKAAMYFARESK
jgi:transposase